MKGSQGVELEVMLDSVSREPLGETRMNSPIPTPAPSSRISGFRRRDHRMRSRTGLVVLALLAVLLGGAPLSAEAQSTQRSGNFTEADVQFMQDMIHHHAQALILARMVADRSEREDLNYLARRIDRSQDDEMRFMRDWLSRRGQEVPEIDLYDPLAEAEEHGHHAGHGDHADHGQHDAAGSHDHHHEMAGMLSPEELDALAAAEGEEFDRLFLQGMIYHHEGALDMVRDLLATPRAAQEAELFEFVSHVDSDQRMEIVRMIQLLRSIE